MARGGFASRATDASSRAMSERFTVGGPLRLLIGLGLALAAGGLVDLGRRLEWGVAWTAWIPATVLVLIATHLARRLRLTLEGESLTIETGWVFRRGVELRLAGAELELVQMAGMWAVVLRKGAREMPLALWLTRRRADALVAWLDRATPGGPLPRRERPRPAGDR